MARTTQPTDAAPPTPDRSASMPAPATSSPSPARSASRPDGSVLDDVAKQTAQALRNVMAVLDAAGASEPDIISVRVFLTDTDHFEEMNEVYTTFFSTPRPARTTVYVGLPAGLLVEIDALAVIAE